VCPAPRQNGTIRVGSRVCTQWTRDEGGNDQWYNGTVRKCFVGDDVQIKYDDGDSWTGPGRYARLLQPDGAAAGAFAGAGYPAQPMSGQPMAMPMQAQPMGQPMAMPMQAQPMGQPMAVPMQAQPMGQPMVMPMQGQPTAMAMPMQGQPTAMAMPMQGQPMAQSMAMPMQGQPAAMPMQGQPTAMAMPMQGQPMAMGQPVAAQPAMGQPVMVQGTPVA